MADDKKSDFGKKFRTIFGWFILCLLGTTIGAYAIASFLSTGNISLDVMEVVSTSSFKSIFLAVFLIALVFMLIAFSNHKFKFGKSNGAKIETKGGMKKFYDTKE